MATGSRAIVLLTEYNRQLVGGTVGRTGPYDPPFQASGAPSGCNVNKLAGFHIDVARPPDVEPVSPDLVENGIG